MIFSFVRIVNCSKKSNAFLKQLLHHVIKALLLFIFIQTSVIYFSIRKANVLY